MDPKLAPKVCPPAAQCAPSGTRNWISVGWAGALLETTQKGESSQCFISAESFFASNSKLSVTLSSTPILELFLDLKTKTKIFAHGARILTRKQHYSQRWNQDNAIRSAATLMQLQT